MPTWDKDKPDTVTPDATQVGINDALNRTDHENLIKGIVDIRNKCKRQKKDYKFDKQQTRRFLQPHWFSFH